VVVLPLVPLYFSVLPLAILTGLCAAMSIPGSLVSFVVLFVVQYVLLLVVALLVLLLLVLMSLLMVALLFLALLRTLITLQLEVLFVFVVALVVLLKSISGTSLRADVCGCGSGFVRSVRDACCWMFCCSSLCAVDVGIRVVGVSSCACSHFSDGAGL